MDALHEQLEAQERDYREALDRYHHEEQARGRRMEQMVGALKRAEAAQQVPPATTGSPLPNCKTTPVVHGT
jgi:hypothetical protein